MSDFYHPQCPTDLYTRTTAELGAGAPAPSIPPIGVCACNLLPDEHTCFTYSISNIQTGKPSPTAFSELALLCGVTPMDLYNLLDDLSTVLAERDTQTSAT